MSNIFKFLFGIVLLTAIVFIFLQIKSCGNKADTVKYDTVTTVVVKYFDAISKDTISKWYDVNHVLRKTDTVHVQKIDSIFIDKIKDYDFILNAEKDGTDLRIFAVNLEGMVIKERIIKGVGNTFSITSVKNNVIVKTQLWYSDTELGLKGNLNYNGEGLQFKNFAIEKPTLYAKQNLNYLDRFGVNLSAEFTLSEKPKYVLGAYIKPFNLLK